MNLFLRAAANVVGRALFPMPVLPVQPAGWDELFDVCDDDVQPAPRVIAHRGLGVDERDAEWIDNAGDHWRYDHDKLVWQNKICQPQLATTWYTVPTPFGATSGIFAPYTEVCTPADGPVLIPGVDVHLQTPSAAGEASDIDCGHSAEEGPASVPSPRDGAGHPNLTWRDYLDAANVVRDKGATVPDEPSWNILRQKWFDLADRLEDAAVTAAK